MKNLKHAISKRAYGYYSIGILLVCLAIFVLPSAANATMAEDMIAREGWRKISMDFEGAKLIHILKIFSQQSGLNFIASQDIADKPITLYLENVPLREALEKILNYHSLTYELDEASNIFTVKELMRPKIETVTKVYRLQYARVASSPLNSASSTKHAGLVEAIQQKLTENGKLTEDSRTNSIVITDVPYAFDVIEQTMHELDVPVPQVVIEAEIIDTTKQLVDTLGVEWSNPIYTLTLAGRDGLAFPFHHWSVRDATTQITTGSIVAGGSQNLNLLKESTDTKVLARPKILTLSNETAEIKITGDEATGSNITKYDEEGNAISTEPERFEVGVSLKVTPSVNVRTGEIAMYLEPNISSVEQDNTTSQFNPQKREAKVTIIVKDGETVVIGGLLRKDFSDDRNKIPLLGDIPLLGMLFRDKTKSDKDRELLVFITPRIVQAGGVDVAQLKTTYNRDILMEREQSDTLYRKEEIDKVLSAWDNK